MRSAKNKVVTPLAPVWLQPEAPEGSAVRHVASLCAGVRGVELIKKSKEFSIGECTGRPVRIRIPSGGEFRLYFMAGRRMEPEQEVQVRQVAQELGEPWPQE